MRTTLNIADDVLIAARQLAKRQKRTAGEVISDLARQALSGSSVPNGGEAESFLGFRPLPRRGVIVTDDLVEQIREEEGV